MYLILLRNFITTDLELPAYSLLLYSLSFFVEFERYTMPLLDT